MTAVDSGTRREVLGCRQARDAADLAVHQAIRHAVFVEEQHVFAVSDRDARDDDRTCLHIVGFVDCVPAGTVRLYPLDPADPAGDWQGDRLAVLPQYRRSGLGRPLVRFAVAAAGELGGRRMVARVQAPNLVFFRRLGWNQLAEPAPYLGLPHVWMDIDLGSDLHRDVGSPARLSACAER
ncbi:MSMEG_0567/Sll0786 family nitrogen starvation N-acetyltransferase [Pseudonocardia sp.]|uniref:MSMEG_0567/Sll0786 family nitrogen starvation N-acetyltransferase n=1 Tax=Pseudonocardia sp. TaxID=60912 RepID=UPI003D118377